MWLLLSITVAASNATCSIALRANMTLAECNRLDFMVKYPDKGDNYCSETLKTTKLKWINAMNITLRYIQKYKDASFAVKSDTETRKVVHDKILTEQTDLKKSQIESDNVPEASERTFTLTKINKALNESLSIRKNNLEQSDQTKMNSTESSFSTYWSNTSVYLLQAKNNWESLTDIFRHVTNFNDMFANNVKQMEHVNHCGRILQRINKNAMLDFTPDDAGIQYVDADVIKNACWNLLSDERNNSLTDSVSSNSDRCVEYDKQHRRAPSSRQLLQRDLGESEGDGVQPSSKEETCIDDLKHFKLIPDSLTRLSKYDATLGNGMDYSDAQREVLISELEKLCDIVEEFFKLEKTKEDQENSAKLPSLLADSRLVMDEAKLASESQIHCVDELFAIFDAYKANVEMEGKVKSCAGGVNSDLQSRVDACKSALQLVLDWEAYPIANLYYFLKLPRHCLLLDEGKVIYIYVSSAAAVFAVAVLLSCFGSIVQCCVLIVQCCRPCCKCCKKKKKARSNSSSSSDV